MENKWISVKEVLPDVFKHSDLDFEDIYVIATNGTWVRPMLYERVLIRNKIICRWKYPWERIYPDDDITYWMALPNPPSKEA